jgi:hypothetical protein
MPPLKTQVSCPNCRAPVVATIEQLFDVAQDPSAKNRFLSGRFNLINCPNCRYQGQVATPVLYHDAEKELFLSFVPMELGLPQMEQEKIIGKLMNEVINKLPPEKRKGYLLNPKPALTLQGLMDRVLEGEGVTREMLDAQKAKAQLIQQLLTTPEGQLAALAKEKDAELDYTFFQLLTASAEAQAAGGNQAGAERLVALRQKLLDLSSFGAQSKQRTQAYEAAIRELQALGDKLTPDKLFELIVNTADEDKIAAYASFARPMLDYAFFEALTRRIDKAGDADKERLTKTRDLLLQLTQEMDAAAKAQMEDAANTLRALLEAPDLDQAIRDSAGRIDDTFMAVLNMNLEAAQKAGRPDILQRLEIVSEAIMRLMQESAPPEIRFINELLQMSSDEQAEAVIRSGSTTINQQLIDAMTYIVESLRQNNQPQLAERLEKLQNVAIGELMTANWKN